MFKFQRYSNITSEKWIELTHLMAEFDALTPENYNEFVDRVDDIDYFRILQALASSRQSLKKE